MITKIVFNGEQSIISDVNYSELSQEEKDRIVLGILMVTEEV